MRTLPVLARALVLSLLLSSVTAVTSVAAPVRLPADPRSVVELRSDADGRTWRGTMSIAFSNTEADPLTSIHLRLWSNGVQGCTPLAIEVSNVTGGTAGPLAQRCTELEVVLDDPLAQGERATIAFRLVIRVPQRNDRFGHVQGLSLLGSALPALAVYDDAGWNLPPFVDIGESFYSVVGSYRVTLDTPRTLGTAATGIRIRHRRNDRRAIDTYVASDVRDFEWATGAIRRVVGEVGSTRVGVWYLPAVSTRAHALQMLSYAERSMRTFIASFGEYPYPEVDVVLTGFASFGGMEYPTLVFSISNKYTIAHELAHQWWYGIVGNDEFSDPWFDEGLATWSQSLPWDPWVGCRGISWPSGAARMTNDMDYWRDHPFEYGPVVYSGSGCMMAQLARGFGLERFLDILARFAERHRFGIVRVENFRRTIERAADRDWPTFPVDFWSDWRVDS